MVELRKRPAPAAPPAPAPAKKKTAAKPKAAKAEVPPPSNPASDPTGGIPEGAGGVSATADVLTAEDAQETAAKVEKEAVGEGKAEKKKGARPAVGEKIEVEEFGGEIETHEGMKTSLGKLLGESEKGVVIFTYPKASTPGCTKQACLFRDDYAPLTATGLSIYGLSADSPKAQTTFKTKQSLPYTLLCDPAQTLIAALGFKKAAKSTTRGVFVVAKDGEVLALEAGGPAPTVEVVKAIVEKMGS